MQDEHIEELLAHGPPALVPTTDIAAAASTITSGSSRHSSASSASTQQLTKLQASLAAMIKTVATQAAALTALTKQVADGASTRDDGRLATAAATETKIPQQKSMHAPNANCKCGTKRKTAQNTNATPTTDGQYGRVRSNRMRRGGRCCQDTVLNLINELIIKHHNQQITTPCLLTKLTSQTLI